MSRRKLMFQLLTDQVAMHIEEQEVKAVVGNVGEENELQPSSQSQHKKEVQEVKVGVGNAGEENELEAPVTISQQKGKLCVLCYNTTATVKVKKKTNVSINLLQIKVQ
jgi:hypothetical protein